MRISEKGLRRLLQAIFVCTVLMLAGPARARRTPEIHPPKIRLEHGVVTGVRRVAPNAAELGALTNVMGRISCFEASIKQTSIFRVETASHYFDLSKLCGGAGTSADFWRDYEHLRIGEQLTFRITNETEPRTSDQASRCHFLTGKSFQRCEELRVHGSARLWQARCTCHESYAYVEHRKVGVWRFLVVGRGPKPNAGAAQGNGAWIHFEQGVVTAIGWTRNFSLVGSKVSVGPMGRVSCNGNSIRRVPIYRIIAGSHYFDLEDGCDEADLMDLGTDEVWGEDARLKIGQQITFHVENNPDWDAGKHNTAQRVAWVDHGDHVWEFSIARSGVKSALPPSPAFGEPGSGGSPSNKCGGVRSYPVAIYKPEPPYSQEARQAKKSGAVVMSFVVDSQGNVTQEKIIKSAGMGLDQSALKTLKTWEFKPAMCDGVPMPMRLELKFSFRSH